MGRQIVKDGDARREQMVNLVAVIAERRRTTTNSAEVATKLGACEGALRRVLYARSCVLSAIPLRERLVCKRAHVSFLNERFSAKKKLGALVEVQNAEDFLERTDVLEP